MLVSAIFARFGRQNRLFEQNATKREKTQDWLAERIGFELVVAFRWTPLSGRGATPTIRYRLRRVNGA
jgi:hypothetical protein